MPLKPIKMEITDEILEMGKRDVFYDRQLACFGKEKADAVLYFWLKGYEFRVKKEVFEALDIMTKENGYKLHESDCQQAIDLSTYSPILQGRDPKEMEPFVTAYRESNGNISQFT